MEFSLDQYPQHVQTDLRDIANRALKVGTIALGLDDERSPVEVVSGLRGEPYATARGEMVLRILRHHQDEEV